MSHSINVNHHSPQRLSCSISLSLSLFRLYSKVAFLETDIKKTGSLVLFLVNRFVDLGFIVDIGFTFFLPYINAQGNPVKAGRLNGSTLLTLLKRPP